MCDSLMCLDGEKRGLETKVYFPAGEMRRDVEVCEGVVDVLAECFGEDGPAERGDLFTECLKLLDEVRCAWIVAVCGGRVVAALATADFTDATHILNLGVDPDYRNQGLARYLLYEAQKVAITHHKTRIYGHVDRANSRLLSLYRHLGCTMVESGIGSSNASPPPLVRLQTAWGDTLTVEDVTAMQKKSWNTRHNPQNWTAILCTIGFVTCLTVAGVKILRR